MEPQSEKYQRLVEIIFKMNEEQDIDRLLQILLQGALELVNVQHGSVFKLDYSTGKMMEVGIEPERDLPPQEIEWGTGIIGKALKEKETVIVDDINKSEWQEIFVPCWENMRSEIAIPIVLDKMSVRVGQDLQKDGSKRIGVLNLESEDRNTFTEKHKRLLLDLARYAAFRIEDIKTDLKLTELRKKEREIADDSKDYNQIIKLVITSIVEILKFDVVNISLVNLEKGVIETKHIEGIQGKQKDDFISRATHDLNSRDIQADMIRSKKIEVPEKDDPRLDRELAKDFEHEKLVRVFIPMIETAKGGMAIGTVECGYKREYREFIYERDIQILESFVNHATQALENSKKSWLEIVTHELRNPILGIRNHTDILSRRWYLLENHQIVAKLDDLATDTELLFYQVRQLEVMLGTQKPRTIKIREVSIYNETIKVVKQLKPLLRDRNFKYDNINCKFMDGTGTRVFKISTDRLILNQVFYNLLINSIKYSQRDPNKFKIDIIVENRPGDDFLRIRFQDYGIGIKEDEKDSIFEYGFRSGEAKRSEQGSGFGLSISKDSIERLGGSLQLTSYKDPTEFQITLKKYINNN